jgi:hypothetical protein
MATRYQALRVLHAGPQKRVKAKSLAQRLSEASGVDLATVRRWLAGDKPAGRESKKIEKAWIKDLGL